jgi:murein DD-endopeptidase MepM/ murein hydrolase activator NlpD
MPNAYHLPVHIEDLKEWSTTVSKAHIGDLKYAIDLEVPKNTRLYAAAKGTVVYVQERSRRSGAGPEFNLHGNRIVIEHENGEYSAYEHLRYMGVKVKVGEEVEAGQFIGFSGQTGNSPTPHLHFEVFVDPSPDKSEGGTIEVSFKELHGDYKRNELT